MRLVLRIVAAVVLVACLAGVAQAGRSTGQLLYVPCYSHIYHYQGVKDKPFNLAITLSVRNTDMARSIILTQVDYFDTDGNLVRAYLKAPMVLTPLMTREFLVSEPDRSGGSGANFLVRWNAEGPANLPVVESVMIGTSSNQGISFTSRAQEIEQ
ncbi:MAG: DUF3124 domain-containing protein [Desulfovibrionaceae bacterium]|jgi:hypothetical protein|nr:DUF3124 domain-containing protein [Desulfovibrionaceae bacterium]